MNTTKKHFEIFKQEFLFWHKELGLTDWALTFEHKNIGDCFAQVEYSSPDMTACVRLNAVINANFCKSFNPAYLARHEVFHLLIARFASAAESRFSTQMELDRENEALANKLEVLLGGNGV